MTAPTRRRPPATLHAARAAGHPVLNWEAGEEKGNGAERGGGDITGSTQQQSRPTRHGRAPHDRRKGERCLDVTERSGQSRRDGNGAREKAGSASGRGKARVRGPLPDNAGSSNSRFGASVGSAHAPGVRRFGERVRPTPSPRRPATTTRPTGSPQTRRHLPTGDCGRGGGEPRWVGGGALPHHPARTVVGVWRGYAHYPCHSLSPLPYCQRMRAERKEIIAGKDTRRRWRVTPCGRHRRRVDPPAAAAPAPAPTARARAGRGNSKAPLRRRRPGLVRLPPLLREMTTGLIPPRPPVRSALSAVDRLPAGCETGDSRYPPLGCATALERKTQYGVCIVFSFCNGVLSTARMQTLSMGAARHRYPEQGPRAFLLHLSIHRGA